MVRRFPNLAEIVPHSSSAVTMEMLRVRCSTPPAAIPPWSRGKFSSFPIATIMTGMDREHNA